MTNLLRCLPHVSIAAFTLVFIAACNSGGTPTRGPLATVEPAANPTPTPTMTLIEAEDGAVQMKLHMSENGSQQSGTLTITQIGDETEVVISLNPAAPVGQPVTIRRGSCDQPTGYVRNLDAVIGGILKQRLRDMPIGEFAMGDLTVIVAPSYGSLAGVSACAEVPRLERPDLPGYMVRP